MNTFTLFRKHIKKITNHSCMQQTVASSSDHLFTRKDLFRIYCLKKQLVFLFPIISFLFFFCTHGDDVNISSQHIHFDTFFLPKKKGFICRRWELSGTMFLMDLKQHYVWCSILIIISNCRQHSLFVCSKSQYLGAFN